MAKKLEKTIEQVIEKSIERVLAPIAPLSGDYGREDLNQLRDKINEIIQRV